MAVLGTVMGSVTSGMATLGKAAQLLGAVLSPVLLPAAVLLGTAFVAAADLIEGAGAPALQGFFALVLGIGVPALVTFFDIVVSVSQKLGEWYEWFRRNTGDTRKSPAEETADERKQRVFDEEREKLRRQDFKKDSWWTPQYTDIVNEATRRANERIARGDTGGDGPAERPRVEAAVFGALRDVAASLKMSVGPKAQIGGLEGIGRAAQLAALNQDPIEARMLRVQEKIAAALEGAIAELTRARGGVYVPPTDRLRTERDGLRALEAGRAARADRGG